MITTKMKSFPLLLMMLLAAIVLASLFHSGSSNISFLNESPMDVDVDYNEITFLHPALPSNNNNNNNNVDLNQARGKKIKEEKKKKLPQQ